MKDTTPTNENVPDYMEMSCSSQPPDLPPWTVRLCEAVFDITLNAQHLCEARTITVEDSCGLLMSALQWAKEFELKHSEKDGEDYTTLIDEYAEEMLLDQYGVSLGAGTRSHNCGTHHNKRGVASNVL